MKAGDTQRLAERKTRIEDRLDSGRQWESPAPLIGGGTLHCEVAGRVTATALGGIGLVHEFVRHLGLAEALDRNVGVLKRHFPYHEPDHILSMVYNVMLGGTSLEDDAVRYFFYVTNASRRRWCMNPSGSPRSRR